MKTRGFFNLDQAIQYLQGSIIRVAGHPVVISRVDSGGRGKGNFKLVYSKVDDRRGNELVILSDADEVDMNPMPMGMLALRPGNEFTSWAQYLARVPMRAMKVGITRNSTFINPVVPNTHRIDHNCMYSPEFVNMVKGNYMTFKEALAASEKKGCYPFSRRFAVDNKRDVYYKTYQVPVGKAVDNDVALVEDAFFLKEVLREDLHGR